MAIPSDTVWEMRTTGTSTNGGGFSDANKGGSGTDYSQQDAAQLSLSDIQCSASTTVTSTGGGFTAAMQGNVCYITGGGATTGFYCITGYTSGTQITVDRTPGTVTNGTCNVGGAQSDIQTVANGVSAGNYVWLKAGSYVQSTTLNFPDSVATSTAAIVYEGYTTTRGDGTEPLAIIDGNGGSYHIATIGGNYNNYSYYIFKYLEFYNSSLAGNYYGCFLYSRDNWFYKCRVRSCGYYGFYSSSAYWNSFIFCEACYFGHTGVSAAGFGLYGWSRCYGCTAHTGNGTSTRTGFYVATAASLSNCIAYDLSIGFLTSSTTEYFTSEIHDCIAYDCGYGMYCINETSSTYLHNFISHSCTYGYRLGTRCFLEGIADYNSSNQFYAAETYTDLIYLNPSSIITLSTDPFVDASNKDFRIKPNATDILSTGEGKKMIINGVETSYGFNRDYGCVYPRKRTAFVS